MGINESLPSMQKGDLLPGDILLSYVEEESCADHSLIWTSGEKPLVHCVDAGAFNGVFAESGNRLGKKSDGPYMIVRPLDETLGAHAARIAALWATSGTNLDGKLATPYSQDRLSSASNDSWDAESYVRAVRAYVRSDLAKWRIDDLYQAHKAVLSENKGVTCSQLVTYAYQAGAIAYALAQMKNSLLKSLIFQMDQHEWFDDLKKRGRYGLMYDKLASYEERLTEAMPACMHVDAKTRSVSALETDVLNDNYAFAYVGNILA
jgi:hypothetical protein